MDEYIGIVKLFAGNFAPQNWMFCQGQLLPISAYQALFAILGTYYGGNGTSNFALPDLRGRVAVGTGVGPGLSPINLGQTGGVENLSVLINNMPAHNHAVTGTVQALVSRNQASVSTPGGNYLATTSPNNTYNPNPNGNETLNGVSANLTTAQVGQGLPIASRNPYLGLSYIICYNGLFPPHG